MQYKKAYTFDDLNLVPQFSNIESRKKPNVETTIGTINLKIPIIAAPMNTIISTKLARKMNKLGGTAVLHRYSSIEKQVNQFSCSYPEIFCAIGASGDFMERATELYNNSCRNFCIDIANGHSLICINAIKKLKSKFNNINIMAGNVCTYKGAKALYNNGANIIRVGIGGGSVCKTRLVTGFGVPQLTAIEDVAEQRNMVSENSFSIVADGGIRNSGDIVKALAMGADAVMIGGLLAGTKESPGQTIEIDGNLYKQFMGMASEEGRASWFNEKDSLFVPEGASVLTPYKGKISKIITQLIGGLKVGMTFANAKNLKELYENAEWIEVTNNGHKEGNPNTKIHKIK
jgi:IMP dehydrogenase